MKKAIWAAAAAFLIGGVAKSSTPERPPDYKALRTSVAGLLGWRVGLPGNAFGQVTLLETADKAKANGLAYVEGYSTQKVSAEIGKSLDFNLSPGELSSIKSALTELKVKMPAYHVDLATSDEASCRKVFEFAKALGVDTLISAPPPAASLAAIDKMANEFEINVAIEGADSKAVMNSLQAQSKRMGVAVDLGAWMHSGIKPVAGLRMVSPRLLAVNLRDESALGEKGHAVPLGSGVAGLAPFLMEMNRLERPESLVSPSQCGNCSRALVGIKPIFLAIEPPGATDSDLSPSLVAFDKAVQPAMGDFVDAISRATPITPTDSVPAEDKQKIAAALPHEAPVKPLKPRKLLILDLCPAGGYYHTTIAYANFALGLLAKTGAYEPVFSNDLDNLKYPKIKQFDAVFLNSTVGEDFVDPEVLNGLIRFVKEGGGLAGIHGATYASMDIPEFGDLIGAQDGPHKVETVTLKVDDPNSPLTKGFAHSTLTAPLGGEEFSYTDEFYHFLPTGPYSRGKLHVLLSIDTGKSDMSNWNVRPDNDYGLSWIRGYGKGRVFNCALGHTPALFETPALAEYILAGIQYVLGDLPADSTPSAKLMSKME